METEERLLRTIRMKMKSLCIFNSIREDEVIKKLYNIDEQISTCTLVLKVGILIGNDQSDKFYLSFVLIII